MGFCHLLFRHRLYFLHHLLVPIIHLSSSISSPSVLPTSFAWSDYSFCDCTWNLLSFLPTNSISSGLMSMSMFRLSSTGGFTPFKSTALTWNPRRREEEREEDEEIRGCEEKDEDSDNKLDEVGRLLWASESLLSSFSSDIKDFWEAIPLIPLLSWTLPPERGAKEYAKTEVLLDRHKRAKWGFDNNIVLVVQNNDTGKITDKESF